jgi:DNA-binding response OmpR family regulator
MPDKILIIDDDVDTLRLVGLILQRDGYQILAAADGPQGLNVAESELPDIILLDVMMPHMDGYEVARQLRANQKTAHIPILIFTARTQIEAKVAGFESGADAYLTKPTHASELQMQVRSLLARSKDRQRPAGSRADRGTDWPDPGGHDRARR